jgi:hypothetical protein
MGMLMSFKIPHVIQAKSLPLAPLPSAVLNDFPKMLLQPNYANVTEPGVRLAVK